MGGSSEKALKAGTEAICKFEGYGPTFGEMAANGVLVAAHDPTLGLDRSVCLRDVVTALQVEHARMEHEEGLRYGAYGVAYDDVADFIEREFVTDRQPR